MMFEIVSQSEIHLGEAQIVPADGLEDPESQYRAAWEKTFSTPGISLDKLYKEFLLLNQLYGAVDASTEASKVIDEVVQRALKDVKEILPLVSGLQDEYLMDDGGLLTDLRDLTAAIEKPGNHYRLGRLVAEVENSIKVIVKYHGLLHFLLGRGVIAWPSSTSEICAYWTQVKQTTDLEEPAVQIDSSGFRPDPDAIIEVASQLNTIAQFTGSALLALSS
jgi:hypothetical protein